MAAGNGFGFETGSNGDTIVTGNSGADNIGSPISGTMVISTAQKAHGTRSMLVTAGSASGVTYISKTITGTDSITVRVYVRWTALPTGTIAPCLVWLGNGTSQLVNLEVTAAGLLRIRDDASANAWTSTAAFSTGIWYRVEFSVFRNASTGTVRAAIYTLDGSTAIEDSGTITGKNTGAAQVTTVRIGMKCATGTMEATGYIDDWDYDPATTTFIGPFGIPPTVDAGVNQNVTAASTVNLSATANDSDGSIASHAWTYVSAASTGSPTLTGGSTATPSFTAGSAGNVYTLQDLVTDNDGFTASDTVEIRVPVTGATTARPIAVNGTGTGTWTIGGGSGSDGAALADASDATYVESPAISGSEVNRRVRWQPSAARTSGVMKHRLWTDTGTANTVIRLYEGNTLRQSWSQAITSTPTEYSFTVTSPGAISDWGNLFVELGATT